MRVAKPGNKPPPPKTTFVTCINTVGGGITCGAVLEIESSDVFGVMRADDVFGVHCPECKQTLRLLGAILIERGLALNRWAVDMTPEVKP